MKNRLFDATLVAVDRLVVDGEDIDLDRVVLELDDTEVPSDRDDGGVPFPLRCVVRVRVAGAPLADGPHDIS